MRQRRGLQVVGEALGAGMAAKQQEAFGGVMHAVTLAPTHTSATVPLRLGPTYALLKCSSVIVLSLSSDSSLILMSEVH